MKTIKFHFQSRSVDLNSLITLSKQHNFYGHRDNSVVIGWDVDIRVSSAMFPLIAYFIGNNSSQPDLFNYAEHEIVECGTDNGRNTWTGSTNIVCCPAWPRKSEDTINYLEICLKNNLIALFIGITSLMTKINGFGIIEPLRLRSLCKKLMFVLGVMDSNPGRA